MNSKAIPDRILISWISELEKHENSIILNSLSYFRNIPEIDFCFGITGILEAHPLENIFLNYKSFHIAVAIG